MTGMGIGGMEGVIAREDHNYRHGIREGERRMLRLVFIGAACADVITEGLAMRDVSSEMWVMLTVSMHRSRHIADAALESLAASGDEDASRVLRERGQ